MYATAIADAPTNLAGLYLQWICRLDWPGLARVFAIKLMKLIHRTYSCNATINVDMIDDMYTTINIDVDVDVNATINIDIDVSIKNKSNSEYKYIRRCQ